MTPMNRKQIVEVSCLLPLSGSLGSDLCLQACQQASLAVEPFRTSFFCLSLRSWDKIHCQGHSLVLGSQRPVLNPEFPRPPVWPWSGDQMSRSEGLDGNAKCSALSSCSTDLTSSLPQGRSLAPSLLPSAGPTLLSLGFSGPWLRERELCSLLHWVSASPCWTNQVFTILRRGESVQQRKASWLKSGAHPVLCT